MDINTHITKDNQEEYIDYCKSLLDKAYSTLSTEEESLAEEQSKLEAKQKAYNKLRHETLLQIQTIRRAIEQKISDKQLEELYRHIEKMQYEITSLVVYV
jgi:hypothetical protein